MEKKEELIEHVNNSQEAWTARFVAANPKATKPDFKKWQQQSMKS